MTHHKHKSEHHHEHYHKHERMHESHHEYKPKDGMIDNRMVHDNHQQGIARVLQRRHDRNDVEGHHGKMGMSHEKSHFARKGDSLTPRKA